MPLDIRIRFDRAIRRLREEQNINQEEAAKRCGVHRTCTGRYLSGFGCLSEACRSIWGPTERLGS